MNLDINYPDSASGKTALYVACEANHPKVVQILVRHPDIDVMKATSRKKTPLYVTVERENVDCLLELFPKTKQEHLFQVTKFGTTPLFIAQRSTNSKLKAMLNQLCKKKSVMAFVPGTSGSDYVSSEVPRFLSDIQSLSEQHPSQFNGGVQMSTTDKSSLERMRKQRPWTSSQKEL